MDAQLRAREPQDEPGSWTSWDSEVQQRDICSNLGVMGMLQGTQRSLFHLMGTLEEPFAAPGHS